MEMEKEKRNETKCGHVIKWKFPDTRKMVLGGRGRAVNLGGGNVSSFHFFASCTHLRAGGVNIKKPFSPGKTVVGGAESRAI